MVVLATSDDDAHAYVSAHIVPTLNAALVELCRQRPADPVTWLAQHLKANKPAKPLQSQTPEGLCQHGSAAQKQAFVDCEWMPFYAEMQQALAATATKHALGVSLEEVLPPQSQWESWMRRCMELTAVWHGSPNISAMYQLLTECSEYDGISPYRFQDVPSTWSDDGWTRAVDGRVRGAFAAKAKELEAARGPSAVAQTAGESAIDNTVLPNILTREESKVLLAGRRIKQVLVGRVAALQKSYLRRLAESGALGTAAPLSLAPAQLKALLASVDANASVLKACRIVREGTAWGRLVSTGVLMTSVGEFDAARRVEMEAFIKAALSDDGSSGGTGECGGGVSSTDELDEFVAFVRKSPGRLYQGDASAHRKLLLGVLLSDRYVVLKRSALEAFTNHRFLTTHWERTSPLVTFSDDGAESCLRPAGAREVGRLRKNGFPYFASHGMGLTSSGLAEGESERGGLAYELGAACA